MVSGEERVAVAVAVGSSRTCGIAHGSWPEVLGTVVGIVAVGVKDEW